MKNKKKVYSVNLPINLVNRLQFLKRIKKGKVDIGKEATSFFYKFIQEMEKKHGLNNESWKQHRKCPKCDSYLIIKEGKRGKFYGCHNYPNCKWTESIYTKKQEDKK